MPKWFKTILAILLLPVCAGAISGLWRVIAASGRADSLWVAAGAGALCWWVIFLLLPKPMWVYVLGHELTHALWVWMMGGQVKKFKASSEGGHVVVTKNNFLIALAPYFFPLYAILVVGVFVAGGLFWNLRPYVSVFHLLLGAAYGFHLTLTWHVLNSDQSDITSQGYLFSAVIILLGNATVLFVAIPVLGGQVGVGKAFQWWWNETEAVVRWVGNLSWPRTYK